LVIFEMHDKAVDDDGNGFHDGVELRSAQAYASAIERSVTATGDHTCASVGNGDPVALSPDAGKVCEIGGMVSGTVGGVPKPHGHRRHGTFHDEFAAWGD